MLNKYRGFIGWGTGIWIVVLVSALAWGCGSSDSSSGTGSSSSAANTTTDSSTTPLTKAAFVKQASAVCRQGSDQIHAEEQPFFKQHGIKSKASVTAKESEEFISEVVAPSVGIQAEGVAALGAPKGDEQKVGTIVEGIEEVAKAAKEAPASILKETPGGPLAKVNKAAEAYGVGECKQP